MPRGEILEEKTEAYIDGAWHIIARERRTYNAEGKVVRRENLAGQVTTTEWDCCHKISETQPDGSTTTWDYDDEGRMVASSRLIPLDMTNVTWLTTCYAYDDLGRQIATWQTNYAAQVGLPVERTAYDALGRVVARIDTLGNTTTTTYSPDGRTVSVQNPNTSTRTIARSADGDLLSITGTAVTPEFHTYGILPDGTRWSRTVQGETPSSPRFTKPYENLLGQTVREERSGFKGAVLSTTHTYDSLGRLVRTSPDYEPTVEHSYDITGARSVSVRSADGQWRKTETTSAFAAIDGVIWLTQSNIVSCSDTTITSLATSSSRQLTGLTAALSSRSRSTDVRGNSTENEMLVDLAIVTSRQTVPYATNKPLSLSRYGVSLMDVSVSAVTNTYAYDPLGRPIAHTDGRGNTSRTEYNAIGQRTASIDALGNRTSYAYDQFGNLAAVTNPLGNAIVYEYDLRGRKTYEGGATYPVRYTYDVFGNKTTMMTYRNESLGPDSGDVTTWLYDEASNCMTNKVYADGKGPTYSYTLDGRLSQRIWARGIVTDYSYDGWGNLTNTVYSDATPTATLFYDVMGRQTDAVDAAGVTTFRYDDFGSLTNETVIGIAGTNTIIRHWNAYGRTTGYSLVGRAVPNAPQRQTTIGYDAATGRIATMLATGSDVPFIWSYLPGSDLKSSLAYPNGLTASWTYDANGQLLQVRNVTPTNVISQYDYTYDAAGRRIEITRSGSAMSESRTDAYGYNIRNELISATKLAGRGDPIVLQSPAVGILEYSYQYDDVGNRITSTDLGTNRTYVANSLNQYMLISNLCDSASLREEFVPQFDDDGNQTLIQTSTGVWSVQYNGENRPVLWTGGIPSAMTNIVMSFDRMGRRVHYLENCGMVTNTDYVFTYDSYHCIARHRKRFGGVTLSNLFTWHSVDLISFSPLVVCGDDMPLQYYTYDGRNNVSELVFSGNGTDVSTHYDYVSAVGVSAKRGISSATNPWRFSSEYADDTIGCVYYNYRHFDPGTGRWMTFDALEDLIGPTRYLFLKNKMYSVDYLGLYEEFSHFYMIAWLAHQHLQDPMDAKALAYGSQYPDTEDWDPIRNVLADDKIYRPISQLHNLNGFNRGEVEIYRCCVLEHCKSCMDEAQQIADGKKRHLKLFECGVFLHTLGDTYAHTKSGDVSRDKDAGSAYPPRIGHFFDGKSPDNPSKDLDKYSDFIYDVNSIFTTRDVKVGELARLRILDEIMREQANNSWWRFWEDSDYKRAIKRLVEEEYQFDYNKNEELLSKGPRPSSDGGNSLRDNLNGIITGKVLPKLDECYRELGK